MQNKMKSDVNWIKKDPKNSNKLYHKFNLVKQFFPQFMFMQNFKELYIEGCLITKSNNYYLTRIYYPENYPYSPPEPIIIDKDVIKNCLEGGKYQFNNWGKFKDGIKPDVIKTFNSFVPISNSSKKWNPDYIIITIISLFCIWLHAYEYKKEFGGNFITKV